MPDSRFFSLTTPQSVADICQLIGGELVMGDGDVMVQDVAPAGRAGAGMLCFIQQEKHISQLQPDHQAIIITTDSLSAAIQQASAIIVASNPRAAFAMAASTLIQDKSLGADNREHAFIDKEAQLDPTAMISAFCVIGANVQIGANSYIGPSATIHAGVVIGENCHIDGHVHIQNTLIGNAVRIAAGTVIGKAGFGFEMTETGPVHIPHMGRVIIDDGVMIGAGCTIDRGVMDDTHIARHVMIDNQVHIAHNVIIGERTMILGQAGIAGSANIGAGSIIGAQTGIADHVSLPEKTILLSRSAATKTLPESGIYAGFPAQAAKQEWKEQAALRRLVKQKDNKGRNDER